MRITVIFHILICIFICLLSSRIKTESPSRGEYILYIHVALGIKILQIHSAELFYSHFKWSTECYPYHVHQQDKFILSFINTNATVCYTTGRRGVKSFLPKITDNTAVTLHYIN